MAGKILVTYSTNAGSTAEIAATIGEELGKSGAAVDVHPVAEVQNLNSYDAVVLGGPLILGWHQAAMKFLKANQQVLSQKKVAYCITCLNLTATDQAAVNGVPITLDTARAKPPKNPDKLRLPEKHGAPAEILANIAKDIPGITPVSAGFFGGKLDFGKLNLFQMLFVRVIIRHPAGDFRDFDAIRAWANEINPVLN